MGWIKCSVVRCGKMQRLTSSLYEQLEQGFRLVRETYGVREAEDPEQDAELCFVIYLMTSCARGEDKSPSL